MTLLNTIKTLCEYETETYKASLVCEVLCELKHREQAIAIYNTIKWADFINRLITISKESSLNTETYNYITNMDKVTELDKVEYNKLMNNQGNFRVATDPTSKYMTVWFDKFMSYKKGKADAQTVYRLHNYMLSDEELQELFDYTLSN